MKLPGWLTIEKWSMSIDLPGERTLGLGYWKGSHKWFNWFNGYYDGRLFCCRLGPFFYSRGPY